MIDIIKYNKMKKLFLSLLLFALVLVLPACGKKSEQLNEKAGAPAKKSLSALLKGDKGAECTVKTPEGETKIYSQGKRVRIEGVPYMFGADAMAAEPQPGIQVSDGEWMYIWSGKQGTKMNLKQLEELSGGQEDEEQADEPENWEDMVGSYEESGFDYSCEEKNLPDGLFTVPADVEFSDYTEFLSGMADISSQLEEQMENGEEMDMSGLEEIMKNMEAQGMTPPEIPAEMLE